MEISLKRNNPETLTAEIVCLNCLRFASQNQTQCTNCFETLRIYTEGEFPTLRLKKLGWDPAKRSITSEDRQISMVSPPTGDQSNPQQIGDFWNQQFQMHLQYCQGIMLDQDFLQAYSFRPDWADSIQTQILAMFPMNEMGQKKISAYRTEQILVPEARLKMIASESPLTDDRWRARLTLARETFFDDAIFLEWLAGSNLLTRPPQGVAPSSPLNLEVPILTEMVLSIFHWSLPSSPGRSFRDPNLLDLNLLQQKLTLWNPKQPRLQAWKALGLTFCGVTPDDRLQRTLDQELPQDRELLISKNKIENQDQAFDVTELLQKPRWLKLIGSLANPALQKEFFKQAPIESLQILIPYFDFRNRREIIETLLSRMQDQSPASVQVQKLLRTRFSTLKTDELNFVFIAALQNKLDLLARDLIKLPQFQPTQEVWSQSKNEIDQQPELLVQILKELSRFQTPPNFKFVKLLASSNQEILSLLPSVFQNAELVRQISFDEIWNWIVQNQGQASPAAMEVVLQLLSQLRLPDELFTNQIFLQFLGLLSSPLLRNDSNFTDFVIRLVNDRRLPQLQLSPAELQTMLNTLIPILNESVPSRLPSIYARFLVQLPFDENAFSPFRPWFEKILNQTDNSEIRLSLTQALKKNQERLLAQKIEQDKQAEEAAKLTQRNQQATSSQASAASDVGVQELTAQYKKQMMELLKSDLPAGEKAKAVSEATALFRQMIAALKDG